MYEQDYIMRLIREMVRALLKFLFQIDMENPTEELFEERSQKETYQILQKLIDAGEINEAENRLYALLDTGDRNKPAETKLAGTTSDLKLALLFYAYLNEKTDDFLEAHDYSREEIQAGLDQIISQYGLQGIPELWQQ